MILEELKHDVQAQLQSWAKEKGLSDTGTITFTTPPPQVKADVCLPWPLQGSKLLKKKPLDIAQELSRALRLRAVEKIEASAPGFINLRLSDAALCENLAEIRKSPATYGQDARRKRRSILIEFVSANPTGPLHLASGRAASLGDSLARILKRIGHKVWSEYYVNDAGGRVELLGRSTTARYDQLHGKDTPIPQDGYQGDYLKDIAAAVPKEAASWTPEQFGRFAMDRLLQSHKDDMKGYEVSFDRWYLESELYASKAVEKTLEFLKGRGMTYEKDGALWLGTQSVEGGEDDKDRVLVKSTGQPTYFLPDIAYHKDKYDRGWNELVDIFGADHHGYVPRMRAAIAALGKAPDSYHAIVHQLVHLYRGKELVKMSKRAGEFVTLRELVAEVGKDACRFFFAMRSPDTHMNFDLELAKKQSQENPVFYVQYVHARICSIFREAAKAGIPFNDKTQADQKLLSKVSERNLLVKIARFPETLYDVEKVLSPHPLTTYLLELAGLYHPFYEECRVVDAANKELSQSRLALCAGVRAVIHEGLALLGVSSPEAM